MHRMHELARMAEAAGAVMIAAHPYRRQLPFELRHEGDWTHALERAVANPACSHVTAIETQNGRGTDRENAFSAEVAARLNLPTVAASDAHERRDLGRSATEFERKITDLEDLITELKAGRFKRRRSSALPKIALPTVMIPGAFDTVLIDPWLLAPGSSLLRQVILRFRCSERLDLCRDASLRASGCSPSPPR